MESTLVSSIDNVLYLFRASSSYADALTGDINFHGPSCSEGTADDMASCGNDGYVCSHDHDIFLRCEGTQLLWAIYN